MAIIKTDYSPEEKKKHDLRLEIVSSSNQQKFQFRVQRNRVEVECLTPKKIKEGEAKINDWRIALTEPEKVRVFSLILDEYRKHCWASQRMAKFSLGQIRQRVRLHRLISRSVPSRIWSVRHLIWWPIGK